MPVIIHGSPTHVLIVHIGVVLRPLSVDYHGHRSREARPARSPARATCRHIRRCAGLSSRRRRRAAWAGRLSSSATPASHWAWIAQGPSPHCLPSRRCHRSH